MTRMILIFLLLFAGASLHADVVINEVLANEPGSSTSLEWIELYNQGDSPVSLNLWHQIRIESDTVDVTFQPCDIIDAAGFLVVCDNEARFDEQWGDGSGAWGNTIEEQRFRLCEIPLRLTNAEGIVSLIDNSSLPPDTVSQLAWTTSGQDGYSWERTDPYATRVEQALDPTGSTPGRVNSLAPLTVDLALLDVAAQAVNGSAILSITIFNRSLGTISNATVDLYEYDGAAPDSLGAFIASEAVDPIDSAFVDFLFGQYQFPSVYQPLVVVLDVPSDERLYDNRWVLVAPGEAFPPVILSEFQAKPSVGLASEWVELKNVSTVDIDLAGWQLGDSARWSEISSAELIITPGEYLVLTKDSAAFLSYYFAFDANYHEPSTWRALNDTGDSVRLQDNFGLAADRFYYTTVYDSNYTWSRGESPARLDDWGRSELFGGSPGGANQVRFLVEGSSSLNLAVEPRIIAPGGGGADATCAITVRASDASGYILKLYDRQGRLVRTFEDGAADLREQYVWDGRDQSGQPLPIGIYILYFEAIGVESGKTTIVVAR